MSQPPPTDPLAPVRASLAAGDLAAAERTCRAVLAANGSDARAHGLLAHVLHRAGRVEAALEHATRSLAVDPGFVPSLIEQAAAARALGRGTIARDALLELVRRRPRDVALRLDLATSHAALGERDAALAALDAAIALDPPHPAAWIARAQLAPTPAEAVAILRRAETVLPDSIPVLEALADAQHAHATSFEDWVATLRRLCALQPGREPPLLRLAAAYRISARHDRLLARIARALPRARITLRPHPRAHVRAALERRLAKTFHEEGVDASRVRVLPTLPAAEFFATARDCDFALDTIGWSGGMTAIDLLGLGVPTITLPGATMRSRQTAALLESAGAGELVARDEDDYVAQVVALAGDSARRDALSSRLRAACRALHADDRVVDAFADLLDHLVDARASA